MKRAAVLFTLFIVLVIVLADMGRLPHFVTAFVHFLPNGDRLGHLILYGLLNFFVTRAALSGFSSRNPVWVAVSAGLILFLLIALEEYSQNYFPERTADWVDLLASCLGVFFGGLIAFKRRAAE